MHDFCYVSKREAAPIKAELIDLIHRVQDYVMLKQNHKFVNNLMRKNRQKTLKRTYCNIKSNKSATFCNMNTLTYIAKFVTI